MNKLVLYSDRLSQPCRAVEIFLLANNIPYDTKLIDLMKGEQKSKSFKEINLFSKVPVIEDNGFIVKESVAILRYLCRERKVGNNWYPKDSRSQSRVDEYLSWHHLETRNKCYSYVRYMVSQDPLLTGIEPQSKEIEKLRRDVEFVLDSIENIWLQNKYFVVGNEITIADLMAATELEQLKLSGYDPSFGRPNLCSWWERVKNLTNPHYETVHEKLNEMVLLLQNR